MTAAPDGENEAAFSSRFSKTWVRRAEEASTTSGASGSSRAKDGPSSSVRSRKLSTRLVNSSPRGTGSRSSSSSRASIRDTSRAPASSRSMRATSRSIMPRKRSLSSDSPTSRAISVALRMAASGFLNSWERSAAKASVAPRCCSSRWVSSARARSSSPISSARRLGAKEPRSRPRRSRISPARARSLASGLEMVVATTRVRARATARLARKTRNTSRRTAYRASRMRLVDWETTAAPTTSPSMRMGMAMDRTTVRGAPGSKRVAAP